MRAVGFFLVVSTTGCATTSQRLETAMLTRVKAGGPNHQHMLRLAALAPAFSKATGARLEVVLAAALLHDATKEDGEGTPKERFCTHHTQGADFARRVLPGLGYSSDDTAQVATAIAQHMGPCGVSEARGVPRFMSGFCQREYPAPERLEAQVLFDLDMLDLMTVNGVTKVVELRQKGTEFSRESLEASARSGADSAWKSVLDAQETLRTPAGRACGDTLTAHTRAFLDAVEWEQVTTVAQLKAFAAEWLGAHPLPACMRADG
jgi:hypothetical protein